MNEKAGLPIIPDSREDDLHPPQAPTDSQLNLFMAGNQFMVMEALVAAFKQQHPHIRRIYYQTLPPGLQLKQILSGGAVFRGQRIDAAADVYTSVSESAMEQLAGAGKIEPGRYSLYLHNRLVLLVPSGNPAAIATVADLGREDVRISQPDPLNEDIAYPIMEMYRDADGDALVRRIMDEKRAEGTTIMTVVHHRETPLRLLKRTVDVGPVWATEAAHALDRKLPVEMVDPGPRLDQRQRINYYICKLTRSPNPENAETFLQFMATRRARAIYEQYGFIAPSG
ncbi:substrate-binding domain-containing protein [uncultured Desulfosarcina sp.]|uniref:molybdate ABC transporter substrate-binding protein n=1 Tax=uncultured Desulfosarcina sp. TaxID=218289 RepID=UPI0029C90DA4|nr:substrate-binding domain-containing protein [uncultured Desulfosarcina sp.]